MHSLHHIRPQLTLDAAKMITHSVVSSRLDYDNALLHGTSASNLNKLQVTQKTLAAGVICSVNAMELHRQLYWLPIHQRIAYKTAVITYMTRTTVTPAYLSHLIHNYQPEQTLRSADKLLLSVPRMTTFLNSLSFQYQCSFSLGLTVTQLSFC